MNRKRTLQVSAVFVAIMLMSLYLLAPEEEVTIEEYGTNLGFEIHVTMYHYRDGVLINWDHHAGTLTTIGKNYIEDQLGDSPGAVADYIALSNNTGAPSAGWTELPDEITTGGMSRAQGTYQDEGDGVWNITKSFSPTETNSTQLTGLHWGAGASTLLAADIFNIINYENGDTVTITWQITVS